MSSKIPQVILAKKHDRSAQKYLFDTFAPKMLGIASTYTKHIEDAEDIVLQAFQKAFSQIHTCQQNEFFPAWLRKIVINESISWIRKNKNILYQQIEFSEGMEERYADEIEDMPEFCVEDILQIMPLGYKLVFNLYIFEEKKHHEIAEILNISEGTSKSQLYKAKKWLMEFFNQKENEQYIKK